MVLSLFSLTAAQLAKSGITFSAMKEVTLWKKEKEVWCMQTFVTASSNGMCG